MKKNMIILLIFAMITLMISACGKEKKDEIGDESGILLYYFNVEENGLVKVRKDLNLPKDTLSACQTIIYQLGNTDSEGEEEYHPVMNKQVSVESIKELEEGEITIDFGSGYSQMDAGQEILFRAAFVKSLIQLEGVDHILFTVDEQPLTKEDGVAVGVMNEYTFILDSDRSEVYDTRQTVAVYYANLDGNGLVKKEIEMEALNNESMESVVLNALRYTTEEDVKATLPESLIINRINVIQNICYIDCNEGISEVNNGIDEQLVVYSMINSLTSLDCISEVQITINGKVKANINGVSGMDKPKGYDYDYVIESGDK